MLHCKLLKSSTDACSGLNNDPTPIEIEHTQMYNVEMHLEALGITEAPDVHTLEDFPSNDDRVAGHLDQLVERAVQDFGLVKPLFVTPSGTLDASLLLVWHYPPLRTTSFPEFGMTADHTNPCMQLTAAKLGLELDPAGMTDDVFMMEHVHYRLEPPEKRSNPYRDFDEDLQSLLNDFKWTIYQLSDSRIALHLGAVNSADYRKKFPHAAFVEIPQHKMFGHKVRFCLERDSDGHGKIKRIAFFVYHIEAHFHGMERSLAILMDKFWSIAAILTGHDAAKPSFFIHEWEKQVHDADYSGRRKRLVDKYGGGNSEKAYMVLNTTIWTAKLAMYAGDAAAATEKMRAAACASMRATAIANDKIRDEIGGYEYELQRLTALHPDWTSKQLNEKATAAARNARLTRKARYATYARNDGAALAKAEGREPPSPTKGQKDRASALKRKRSAIADGSYIELTAEERLEKKKETNRESLAKAKISLAQKLGDGDMNKAMRTISKFGERARIAKYGSLVKANANQIAAMKVANAKKTLVAKARDLERDRVGIYKYEYQNLKQSHPDWNAEQLSQETDKKVRSAQKSRMRREANEARNKAAEAALAAGLPEPPLTIYQLATERALVKRKAAKLAALELEDRMDSEAEADIK